MGGHRAALTRIATAGSDAALLAAIQAELDATDPAAELSGDPRPVPRDRKTITNPVPRNRTRAPTRPRVTATIRT
ncbi:MAG: hypothetical protein L0H84_17750, partial [Pseudonocardia sp.]|nr:hypothetical protein [Pseudonocardia sp.]